MRKALFLSLLTLAGLSSAPVSAQMMSTNGNAIQPVTPKPKGPERSAPAPSALPGARAEPDAVAPAERAKADLPPTEMLFDAINRGDLATAKEAINRGADIHGRNVLGLTPLELAVDLGRNQISFLLLSLRGEAGYSTARGPQRPATPAEVRAAEQADKLAAAKTEREERAARQRSARIAPPVSAAPQTARLFAGDGGAPVPQAGFLGFDAQR